MVKKSQVDLEVTKALVDNFVSLQKVLTTLAIRFDNLSDNISKLLQLFEISAKTFIDKPSNTQETEKKDREFLEKINTLLEQNKTIAKGLTLMEEKIRERVYAGKPEPVNQFSPNPAPFQDTGMQQVNRFKKLPLA